MPASLELFLDRLQLRPHAFRDRDALDPKRSLPGLRTDVREPPKVERLRFAQIPPLTIPGGVPPELDQPRLVRVQSQPESREPLAKLDQEPPRVLLVVEPDDEVVRLCRMPCYAALVGLVQVGDGGGRAGCGITRRR
jgi:hypothetical protein